MRAEEQASPKPTRGKRRAPRDLALLGMLGALAVALSFLEGLLPSLPIPGAKWGLSNLATMTALYLYGQPAALGVTAVKAGFAALRGGVAGAMSLCGGVLSTLVMAAMRRALSGRVGPVGVGVLGAVAHNAGQLAAAMLLLSPYLVYYAPWLLLTGLLCGSLTGLVVRAIFPLLRRHFPPG